MLKAFALILALAISQDVDTQRLKGRVRLPSPDISSRVKVQVPQKTFSLAPRFDVKNLKVGSAEVETKADRTLINLRVDPRWTQTFRAIQFDSAGAEVASDKLSMVDGLIAVPVSRDMPTFFRTDEIETFELGR